MTKRRAKLELAHEKMQLAQLQLKTARIEQAYKFYKNDNLVNSRKRRKGWSTPGIPERDMSDVDREKALSKARQKVEESPIVMGLCNTLVDNIVGTGFTLQAKTGNDDFDNAIEALWKNFTNNCDVRGVRPFWRILRALQFRKIIDGDNGVALLNNNGSRALQIIEADRIGTSSDQKPRNSQNSLVGGVELNKFGRPLRYFIRPRQKTITDAGARTADGIPIAANKFIHYANYPHERIDRVRGISMLLQNLNNFEDLEQIFDAIKQKVKNEAFMGLFFKLNIDENGDPFGSTGDESESATDESGATRTHIKMVPGLNLNGTPGEEVEIMESKSPNNTFQSFIQLFVRIMGAGFGLPIELALLDFSKTNYSSARAALEQAKKRFRVEQEMLAMVASRIYQWWLSIELKTNEKLKPPTDLKLPIWNHRWVKPAWPYLNPKTENEAELIAINGGLKTRRDAIEESGGDWVEVFEQLKREQDKARELGLILQTSQPGAGTTQNNNVTSDNEEDQIDE